MPTEGKGRFSNYSVHEDGSLRGPYPETPSQPSHGENSQAERGTADSLEVVWRGPPVPAALTVRRGWRSTGIRCVLLTTGPHQQPRPNTAQAFSGCEEA